MIKGISIKFKEPIADEEGGVHNEVIILKTDINEINRELKSIFGPNSEIRMYHDMNKTTLLLVGGDDLDGDLFSIGFIEKTE